jgi:amino acid transporter
MKKFFHHIRKQPEKTRRHILHVLVVVCGIVLVLLWIYSLGTTLTNPDTASGIKQDLQPFTTLKDNPQIP